MGFVAKFSVVVVMQIAILADVLVSYTVGIPLSFELLGARNCNTLCV